MRNRISSMSRMYRVESTCRERRSAIEISVERHRTDRRQEDAAMEQRSKEMRKLAEELLRDNWDHSKTDADRDDQQIVGFFLEIDSGKNSDSGRSDHAEHDQTRPAKDEGRHRCDNLSQFRDQAENDQDDTADSGNPAAAHAGNADKSDIL